MHLTPSAVTLSLRVLRTYKSVTSALVYCACTGAITKNAGAPDILVFVYLRAIVNIKGSSELNKFLLIKHRIKTMSHCGWTHRRYMSQLELFDCFYAGKPNTEKCIIKKMVPSKGGEPRLPRLPPGYVPAYSVGIYTKNTHCIPVGRWPGVMLPQLAKTLP